MIRKVDVDVGSESPKEDYPWRPIPLRNVRLHDSLTNPAKGGSADASKRAIYINNPSCLMGGLDITSKIPVCGLGVPMVLSELDFVYLAVYFDTNLRPIHATICKAPRFTRWYEYGGISMGGFPRSIKTVRRDHIGVDIGPTDVDGFAKPEPLGPEYDYIAHEVAKEVEWLSPYGFLADVVHNPANQPDAKDNLIKALRSEQTYFINDPVQVKQWAAYQLLGYCTSTPPDSKYPYPHTPHSKDIGGGKTLNFWYRQTATTHLMLSETNAGGVRACHIVPSFPPYVEALPHPLIRQKGPAGADRQTLLIGCGNGIDGTLPAYVPPVPPAAGYGIVNNPLYEGGEVQHGARHIWSACPNIKSRVPLPGENALPSQDEGPVIGSDGAGLWFQRQGKNHTTGGNYPGEWEYRPNNQRVNVGGEMVWEIEFDCDLMYMYLTKDRCYDTQQVTLQRKGKKIIYIDLSSGNSIWTGWLLP